MVVLAEQSVALIKVFRFRKSAAEMRASILDHLKDEDLPELSDVHIVRDPSDFKPRMLHFVRAFLLHFGPAMASGEVCFLLARTCRAFAAL
jgi:hypothetical protein